MVGARGVVGLGVLGFFDLLDLDYLLDFDSLDSDLLHLVLDAFELLLLGFPSLKLLECLLLLLLCFHPVCNGLFGVNKLSGFEDNQVLCLELVLISSGNACPGSVRIRSDFLNYDI